MTKWYEQDMYDAIDGMKKCKRGGKSWLAWRNKYETAYRLWCDSLQIEAGIS